MILAPRSGGASCPVWWRRVKCSTRAPVRRFSIRAPSIGGDAVTCAASAIIDGFRSKIASTRLPTARPLSGGAASLRVRAKGAELGDVTQTASRAQRSGVGSARLADRGEEEREVQRLRENGVDAELARAIRDVAAAVRGHENRTGPRLLPAALLPGVEPVTVGQVEVEEQRLEALTASDVEEARHRRNGLHVVAPAGEETYEVLRQQL